MKQKPVIHNAGRQMKSGQDRACMCSQHAPCLPVFRRVPTAADCSEPWELALSREGRPSTEGRVRGDAGMSCT